ncbi:hypothetical protein DFJ67_1351 [Asanoa ferruginea]|uniref:Uncharacterized protein n=1 Tax=Asanoa ferruginea TaxID=53367 RepID=A0A3D9ZDR5_9ACTN|nr:hypothetical protein [Asanoa ferruginea]REF95397.1 hypothetical protein DFJ67_1351 [Asanoa ferruginea]GIF48487.1 hypothetical protein Afe04nite_30260 [Asanoa ferruginea]
MASLLRLAGVAGGLLAAVLLTLGREPGLRAVFAVPALAFFVAAGLLAADRTVPRPPGTGIRTARLARRRLLDYVPVASTGGVVLLTGTLTALLVATSAASTPHTSATTTAPYANDGQHIGCLTGGVPQSGPWPGWYYAIPIAITVFLAAAAAVVALRRLVTRPIEEPYRQTTARSVVAGLGLVVAAPLTGAAYFTYSILGQPLVCESPAMPEARPWLLTLTVLALAATIAYAARLVVPGTVNPDPHPTLATVR